MGNIKARDLEISICFVKEVRKFIEKYHYSHNINGLKVTQCFKAMFEGELVGAMLFGQMSTTAWKKFSDREEKVLELRRLVMLDKAGRNSESRFIGYALMWIRKNKPYIKVIVSYADPNFGHLGTIYRASNFKYLGVSGKDVGYYDIESGKTYHSRALRTKYKGKYKPFVLRLREKNKKGLLKKIQLKGKHCYIYNLKK